VLSSVGQGVECHGIVLCGNSVFGLAAVDGVVSWCVEQGRGLKLPVATVPVVGAAVVFDITGPDHPRPTAESGRLACAAASADDPPMGSVGVGRGCSIGKLSGRGYATKGGQGWAVESAGAVRVGALMAVNAFGEVLAEDGSVLAGGRAPADSPRYPSTPIEELRAWGEQEARGNTTIGCLVTNARLTKPEACRAVDLAHTGIARSVDPPHTAVDGDALFLLCCGDEQASSDLVADLGARAVAAAVRAAVRAAEATPGRPRDPRLGPVAGAGG
jgi:L-aminopeptidase/D-esterase-like protein